MLGYQHHGDSDHHFVCHRIEEGTEAGALIPATGQIAIKPVGDRCDQEDQCAGERCPDDRQVKRQYKERDEYDTEESEQRRDIKLHNDGKLFVVSKI